MSSYNDIPCQGHFYWIFGLDGKRKYDALLINLRQAVHITDNHLVFRIVSQGICLVILGNCALILFAGLFLCLFMKRGSINDE